MIRAAIVTDKGPIGIVGISFENLRRLKAGMPLDIDIKAITPPGMRMNRVVVHYAHTLEDVVKDWESGAVPVTDELRQEAINMDAIQKRTRDE